MEGHSAPQTNIRVLYSKSDFAVGVARKPLRDSLIDNCNRILRGRPCEALRCAFLAMTEVHMCASRVCIVSCCGQQVTLDKISLLIRHKSA